MLLCCFLCWVYTLQLNTVQAELTKLMITAIARWPAAKVLQCKNVVVGWLATTAAVILKQLHKVYELIVTCCGLTMLDNGSTHTACKARILHVCMLTICV